MVLVEDLRTIEGFNPRFRDQALIDHIRSLADSMKNEGYYLERPLAGYGTLEGKKPVIYVTEGHCRLEAVKLAILEGAPIIDVPVVIKDRSTTLEDLTVALVRANENRKFGPPELAVVSKRLLKSGWDHGRIGSRLGISPEYVGQLLMIAAAPQPVQDMVQSDLATAAVALAALREHGTEAAVVLASALELARANGKDKLTAKFLPAQIRKKAAVKSAPAMFTVL